MPRPEKASPALSITLFGHARVQLEGGPMPPLRSRKGLWLLALLTLRHDIARSNATGSREPSGPIWIRVRLSPTFGPF